jgi:hypothetical protein
MIVYLFLTGLFIYIPVVYYLCLTSEMPDLMDIEEEECYCGTCAI